MYINIYDILFIHSSVNGHFGCFHVLAIVNSAIVNIGVHVSFQMKVLYRYVPRRGIAMPNALFLFTAKLLKKFFNFGVPIVAQWK